MTSRLVALFAVLLFLQKVSEAQSSLRNTLSIRPVPGLAFDAYLDSVLRQGAMASDIAELSALTRDEKAHPGDALLLAMLLNESGDDAGALTVLRQNAQRNPADRISLAALAQACAKAGFGDEQEAALMQLYQLPAPPHQRLACLRQLAMARQSHGRLRELRDAMVKQQAEQPEDAYGWMELAVIQARAGEDEESRRCVYEASKLRPKDVLLLGEIARREAGFGFITEALSTLDVADQVTRSASTEMLRCLIQLGSGEQTKALATLATFTLPGDADLTLVFETADALAQSDAWSEAMRLLDQAIANHATNYQLHYLHAVALEEKGDRDAAVTAFLSMLTLAAELPAEESLWFGRSFRDPNDTRNSVVGLALPSGSLGLMQSQAAWQSAYNYKQGGTGMCICYAYTQVEDAPRGGFIALPHSLLDAKHLAVAHLRRLLPAVAAVRRAEAERVLVAGGLEHPEVLLGAAGIRAPGLLSRRPHDLALHAARLLSGVYGETLPLEVLDADVTLFRDAFPQLAFLAACRAYHVTVALEAGMPAPATEPESAAARRVVALNLADQVPACPQVIEALLSLMSHRYGPRYGHAAAASSDDLRILARAVDLALHLPEMSREVHAHVMISILRAAVLNGDLPDAIRLVHEIAKSSATEATAPPTLTLGEPVGASLPMPLTELGLSIPVLRSVAANAAGWNAARVFPESKRSEIRTMVAQVPEAEARRVLELCIGDYSSIEAEIKLRLSRPEPTIADHLLAALFTKDTAAYLQHLAAANALTRDPAQNRIIDHAVLRVIGRYREKLSDEQKAFVTASIQRLKAVELHPAFSEAATHALHNIGSVAEVEQAREREEQDRQARHVQEGAMPYSASAAYKRRQERDKEATEQLAAALKARDLTAIAALGREWLKPHLRQSSLAYSKNQLVSQLGGSEAFWLVLQTCRPDVASGDAEQLHYASALTQLGETESALQIYTQLAERDENAFLPRLYAALQLAEQDSDKALALLRSIRLESALADENGVSPVASLVLERGTPSRRAAVARLVTRWLNSWPHPDPLLDRQTCANLIQMIRRGEREGNSRFPDLDRSKDSDDYFTPTGPGAEAMKDARKAHDELCRAMLRLPQAQPTALAALASLVMNEDGDLSDCARIAADMLHDSVARHPLREWLAAGGAGGEVFAGAGYIAVPSPMTILVRHAAQKRDFSAFERLSLPLIEQALGTSAATRASLYARLFSVPETGYPAAAAAWIATCASDENPNVRSFSEALNVWQSRGLRADLTDLLLKSDAARAQLERGNVPVTLTRYITTLITAGRQDEAITFYKALRDQMISSDPAERRRLITAWQEWTARYRSDPSVLHRRPVREEEPSHVYSFASWLKFALRDPKLVCLLPLGMEEGLLGGPDELYQLCYEMLKPEVLRSPDAAIALAEKLGFLAEASDWHNYELAPSGDSYTWISTMTGKLRDAQDTGAIRQRLAGRQPPTLGSEIFAALLAHSRNNLIVIGGRASTDKRDELLHEVLTRRKAELAKIPTHQRRAFSLLLRSELPGYPDLSKFDAGLAATLQPFLDAEADDLVPVLDRILTAREWVDVGMPPRQFAERFPATLAQVARRHPAKVEQVFRHACELLRKTPEDEQQRLRGWSRDTPVARFIWYLGQVPQLLGSCMSEAEREKLQHEPSWAESFTSKLTDYELMRNREHVAAIFTSSPLVADAAHFNDFAMPVRNTYDGVTLLDKVVTALNRDDDTALWLHQCLKAEPEQTFGIQLTLALLDSAAPIRKIKGYSNTARRDPAPLIAFAAAHSKEFAKLSPDAAKVVRTLLDHYLKPPAEKPAQRNLLNDDPFGAPPLR